MRNEPVPPSLCVSAASLCASFEADFTVVAAADNPADSAGSAGYPPELAKLTQERCNVLAHVRLIRERRCGVTSGPDACDSETTL
jgi:hypothetical protein